MLLRNQLYAGIVDVPEYGVRAKRGDFEPHRQECETYATTVVPARGRCDGGKLERLFQRAFAAEPWRQGYCSK
jgi:hypothetical protein